MSGTSADGINVALTRIQGRGFRSRIELLAHYEFPYPQHVRRKILDIMNGTASVGDLSRLDFLLGDYRSAVSLHPDRSESQIRFAYLWR